MAKKKKAAKKVSVKNPPIKIPNLVKKIKADKKKNPKHFLFKELYSSLEGLTEMAASADMEALPKVELEFYANTLTHLLLTLKFRLDALTGSKVRFKL